MRWSGSTGIRRSLPTTSAEKQAHQSSPIRSSPRCRTRAFKKARAAPDFRPVSSSFPLQGFEFIHGARPIFSQQPRQAAIRENFSAGLAACAVVRFFVGVANPQDFVAASRAGLAVAPVNRHIFSKCGDFLGESLRCLSAEMFNPELKSG